VSAASSSEEKHCAAGAAPIGATDEHSAARAVQKMFDEIAPRYDLLNHLLSMSVDRIWWWRTARYFRHILEDDKANVLDLCCGTGDMTVALRKRAPAGAKPYFAADFSHQMLVRAIHKLRRHGVVGLEADALRLPFGDGKFSLVVSAFGFRNLVNYRSGLAEIFRVLERGGEVGILDFSEPGGLMGRVYGFYFRRVLPLIGAMISGVSGAYAYLPASVERFPAPEQMLGHMRDAGFAEVSWTPYTFGIAGLYRGKKL
jgi:demethylmenaquinone methyltransferase/2-methoxy-6-polyprenyl-1,4-benzoquinol methylase